MNLFKKIVLIVGLSFLLNACQQVNIEDYQGSSPQLDLQTFFQGDLMAYGILQDRAGKVTRKFSASIEASWEGNTGTLEEHFLFDDGEQQARTWVLTDLGDGRITGTAGDVEGKASGRIVGSVFQWQYQLEVPYNDGTILVNLDDWLYLVDQNHLINKTELKKFGFRVGELTLVIEKI